MSLDFPTIWWIFLEDVIYCQLMNRYYLADFGRRIRDPCGGDTQLARSA